MTARLMTTEDDLWQHFWEGELPKEGAKGPGNRMLLMFVVEHLIKSTRNEKGRRIKLTDDTRWYRVTAAHVANLDGVSSKDYIEQMAVVPQSRLLTVGLSIDAYLEPRSARVGTNVFVEYLGEQAGGPPSAVVG